MRYHNITTDDMLNGEGLRTVLWVAGCGHRCKGCQNPVTWDPEGGLPFDEVAEAELFAKLGKEYISGLTFSGGDPLYPANRAEVGRLARKAKELFPQKNIWLYTGYRWEEASALPLMEWVDVLVDGKFVDELHDVSLRFRGSSNQRILDVGRSLDAGVPVLWEG